MDVAEFVRRMNYLLYEHEPETPEEIDAFLRSEGFDPDAIERRGREIAEEALRQARLGNGKEEGKP